MKDGNRRCEHLLREAELWSATAAVRGLLDYPYDELRAAWETVLLHQFHDILPGSSIAWVHREARATYARVMADLEAIIERALDALAGDGDEPVAFNAAPMARLGVPALGAAAAGRRAAGLDRGRDRRRRSGARERPCSASTVDAGRRDPVGPRPASRPRGAAARRRGQPARAPPRPPEPLGRLGPRRALPTHGHAADRRRRRAGVEGDVGRGATVVRRLDASSSGSPCTSAGSRSTPTSTGTSARRCSSSPSTATCTPTRRATRRSSGTSSGPRTSTPAGTPPASRCARTAGCWSREEGYGVALANRTTYGHDVTRHPRPGRRHLLTHPGQPAARAAVPRPGHRPGPARVPARDRARRRRRRGRPRRLRPEPARCDAVRGRAVEPLVARRRTARRTSRR